jgi:hypothetical protein
VASFYQFHVRHGVACADLLTMMKSGGSRGSWRPFLAHLSTGTPSCANSSLTLTVNFARQTRHPVKDTVHNAKCLIKARATIHSNV